MYKRQAQYIDEENPGRTIKVKFKYYTYDKDGSPIESDKYCDPGFDYTCLLYTSNIIAMIVVMVVMIFGVLKWLDIHTHHGESVVVPDVKGMTVEEATKMCIRDRVKPYTRNSEVCNIIQMFLYSF